MVDFLQGDELVLLRRRRRLVDEGGEKKEVSEDMEISRVSCPENFKAGKGSCEPEFIAGDKEHQDKRYLTIRLEMLR